MAKSPGPSGKKRAVTSVLSKDPLLKTIVVTQEFPTLELQDKIYLRLCSSIISQQLSTKVAKVIYQRFLNLFGTHEPSLAQILSLSAESLRQIGCSASKASYIRNVCEFFAAHQLTDEYLYSLSDDALLDLLTQIKGIGRWTAEMILIFSMGREDVFAIDDLGLQQAVCKLYNVDATQKKLMKEQIQSISAQWQPYRSYASLYLWRYKDGG